MTDLDDLVDDPLLRNRLERHLERTASDVAVRHTPASSVVARARRRTRRRRATGAVGALVVVIGAATVALLPDPPNPSIVPSEPPPSAAPITPSSTVAAAPDTSGPTTSVAPTTLEAAGLRWTSSGLDERTTEILVSTADSIGEDTPTLTWTPRRDATRPSWLYRAIDGRSFEVVEPGPEIVVIAGGTTGERIDVLGHPPLADGATLADVGLRLASRTSDEPWTFRDIDRVVPEDFATAPGGMHAQGSLAKVGDTTVISVTITTEVGAVTKVYFAPPVGEVLDLSASFEREGVMSATVASAGERFLLTMFHRQGTAEDPSAIPPVDLFTSVDGATWQQHSAPPIILGQIEGFGDTLIAGGPGGGDDWVSINRDGQTWTPVDLASSVGEPNDSWQLLPYGVAPGPDLVAIAAMGSAEMTNSPRLGVFLSSDLVTWRLVQLDGLLGGTSAQLLSIGWVEADLVVRVAVTDTGGSSAPTDRLIVGTPIS